MKVRRLISDCCGMKVGEVYEAEYSHGGSYVKCKLIDGTWTSEHWVNEGTTAAYFETISDPWITPVPLGPEHGFDYKTIHSKYISGKWNIDIETRNEDHSLDTMLYIVKEGLNYIEMPPGKIEFINCTHTSMVCSCGGKIDAHKPECPESKVDQDLTTLQPFYYMDDSPKRYIGMNDRKKCECGSDFLGSPKHSSYCPKFKEE